MEKDNMYLGIDFGTSFSQISTIHHGQPILLLNPGEYGIPSAFYYDKENDILVGQEALDAGQGSSAKNLVLDVKMKLINQNTYVLDGRTFTSEEIITEILKYLIRKATLNAKKHFIDPKIDGYVISIPAKFGIQERTVIKNAVVKAVGSQVEVKYIIKEPVSAAISYFKDTLADNQNVLVFDLGGGTCDVALVRSESKATGYFTVIDSDMVRLGGRNWDEELVKYIIQIIENKSSVRIRGNVGFEEKIRRTAISVKHDLSEKERSIARVELNGIIYTTPISRNVFDEITSHLLRETFDCLQDVYDRNISSCKIDDIICVGGSSNMLQIQDAISRQFSSCRVQLYRPEHAVVNGGASLATCGMINDQSCFSYGIDTYYDYDNDPNKIVVLNILKRGSHLPTSDTQYFRPYANNLSKMVLSIYESEFENEYYDFSEKEKRFVGKLIINFPPNVTSDLSVECTVTLNINGLLEVRAKDSLGQQMKAVFQLENL